MTRFGGTSLQGTQYLVRRISSERSGTRALQTKFWLRALVEACGSEHRWQEVILNKCEHTQSEAPSRPSTNQTSRSFSFITDIQEPCCVGPRRGPTAKRY